ncbi:hypothetical protein DAA51_31115 [Bradyrhizobium sp. WBAH10]|nr:hypothetical protein [Bradyrhizobium sp. WBAH30]MDD1542198.1 hypothetical protein [Bradyrhizobium sp. WBAH41]MDD1556350.1 hypothetical protein [Bradyrhizobium sp. WBAH23]MDD1561809.1 hypothetical protein [Bradyrhizobium sp. WBAH33]MDD1589170.1 hypothetical protein [Bradyrhizobium sp. WBAH42]NRB87667.1 hypothetical protein [Bradyrhizobium sp. WBAH10]QCJ92490.1 hypothetical protein DAA57_31360 [Bradyrhizobium yuanmingense]
MDAAELAQKPSRRRHASEASGIDTARKSLRQQEIAIIQTTRLEPSTGTIQLTTLLVHSFRRVTFLGLAACAPDAVAFRPEADRARSSTPLRPG